MEKWFPHITKTKVILLTTVTVLTLGVVKIDNWTEHPAHEKGCSSTDKGESKMSDVLLGAMATLEWLQFGGTINDASCLDETSIHGIVKIETEEDITEALHYAQKHNLTVSIAGMRHSMGGHAFIQDGLVLDMLSFNDITIDEETRTMNVQSGATWHDIQNKLHPKYAVSAMQSTDIFTVGGSISVNAHGMDHQIGAVENSLVSLRVMLPDGTIKKVSRTENTDLYQAVVGGYGLMGIILDAKIRFVTNDIYESERVVMSFSDFPKFFNEEIKDDPSVGLTYTHLSTAPSSLLDEAIVYIYRRSSESVSYEEIPPLKEVSSVKLRRFFMSLSKAGSVGQQLRWWAEKYLEPKFESCSISRANAIGSGEACFVTRNEPMHDSVLYLYNNVSKETDILHEYFIPRENISGFIEGLREVITKNDINLLNASVRIVHQEQGLLTYAPEEPYSVVLFLNQEVSKAGNEKMNKDTQALIDLTHEHGGRFFLPYQLHYTKEQLLTSYPNLPEFFATKKELDPQDLLSSTFYEYIKH